MLRNYFLVAWRNMLKNKVFTGINIFGLALSISVCMVIILLVHYHYQFDNFHSKGDRTYRITAFNNGQSGFMINGYATTPLLFGASMKEKYSQIELFTNLHNKTGGELRSPNKILETELIYADEKFFQVFDFTLKEGNPITALKEPFSIILTEEKANLLFPDGNALGKMLAFGNQGNYQVTGIINTPPSQTHINYETIASYASIPLLADKSIFNESYNSWENFWENYNYLVLNEGSDPHYIESEINKLASEQITLEEDHPGYHFKLQKITKIVPGEGFIMGNEMHIAVPGIILIFFAFLALIIIITASINYTNLSIARSLTRVKEIGIRKVNGAFKRQIVTQFLIESLIIAAFSLILAIPIYRFLITSINEIWIFNTLGVELHDQLNVYLYFVIFTLFIGLITGIGPSLFLSKVRVIHTLKGRMSTTNSRKGFFKVSGKKVLLGVQFGISIFLLVSVFLLKSQGDFLINSDYGFEEENVYFINMQGHTTDEITQEFMSVSGVSNISFTSHHPGVGRSHGESFKRQASDENDITIYHFSVDHKYPKLMGLEFIAGADFPEININQEHEKFIVINELAVKNLGFENPADAIGKTIYKDDKKGIVITGVVKNYHWEPLLNPIKPLALRIIPANYQYAYLTLSGNMTEVADEIKSKWTVYDSARTFKGGFLSEEMDLFYQFFKDIGNILSLIGFLAITITGLGFLGLVSFDLQSRAKEIGIRKVLGASFNSLVISMSKGFLLMLTLTGIIAFPLAVITNNLWINLMASHAEITWKSVLPAILIIIVIAATTILSQVWKNTNSNLLDTLKSE